MEVGRGSGRSCVLLLARRLDLSLMLPASRGIPVLPSALEPIGSSPCSRLPSRVNSTVPECLLKRTG
jgi:hypothetical protein